jgi:ribose transport system substrate-binding protein
MKNRLLFSVLAAAFLTGCNSGGGSNTPSDTTSTTTTDGIPAGSTSSTGTGKTTSTVDGPHLDLAFVTNGEGDFWTIAEKGTLKAKSELKNVDVEFKIPQDRSAAGQRAIVTDLLTNGCQGIAISPLDPKDQTEFLNGAASKALLITQDSDAPDSNRACYIGTDNVEAGRLAGEEVKKILPNGGKYMMFVGSVDAQNAKERIQGVKQALSDPKYVLLGIKTDDADRAREKQNAADAMVANPDLACEVGLWGGNGPEIYNAVKEAHKQGKVKIVCFDEEPDTQAGIADGAISATVVQHPYQFGYQAVKDMTAYLRGDKSWIPKSKVIYVPLRVIRKDNLADFQKVLAEERK